MIVVLDCRALLYLSYRLNEAGGSQGLRVGTFCMCGGRRRLTTITSVGRTTTRVVGVMVVIIGRRWYVIGLASRIGIRLCRWMQQPGPTCRKECTRPRVIPAFIIV